MIGQNDMWKEWLLTQRQSKFLNLKVAFKQVVYKFTTNFTAVSVTFGDKIKSYKI